LHQRMRFHRLVDVESREALDVEAGQPHGTDDGDAEWVCRILERVLHAHPLAVRRLEASLHHDTMGNDVEAPLLEVPYLVLRFADDDLDDRAFHPLRLATQPFQNLDQSLPLVGTRRSGQFSFLPPYEGFYLGELELPAGLDAL